MDDHMEVRDGHSARTGLDSAVKCIWSLLCHIHLEYTTRITRRETFGRHSRQAINMVVGWRKDEERSTLSTAQCLVFR